MLEPHAGRRHMEPPNMYGHSRTRTTSSNTFPMQASAPTHLTAQPQNPYQQQQMSHHTRRTPSVNTFSTTSSNPPPAAYRTSPTDLRRSGSARSGGTTASTQATGYVALLRKQKATVWCDRSQYEDPRLQAAQRAAKMRANLEVTGATGQRSVSGGLAPSSGRTATGISATNKVAAKIRHHGKPAVVGYSPGANPNHVGVGGVPLRLSATEVEAESSDDEVQQQQQSHHRRTGSSGRSSTASRRGLAYRTSGGGQRYSPGDTPERTSSIMEEEQRPLQQQGLQQPYAPFGQEENVLGDAASGRARSTGSGSSAERADNVGELGAGAGPGAPNAAKLASNSLMNAALTREKSVKTVEELKRRGSVDERTTTLTLNSTGRLFIANPD